MTDLLCPEDKLAEILLQAETNADRAVGMLDTALQEYPDDPRMHFLRGSLLIGIGRFLEAHRAMSTAVTLAPDFVIARFQLGFFELTSGEAQEAITTWAPLKALPEIHFLRRFVTGLEHLIADRFVECVAELRAGIAINQENPALNRDMELIIERCDEILATSTSRPDDGDAISATSLLLGKR